MHALLVTLLATTIYVSDAQIMCVCVTISGEPLDVKAAPDAANASIGQVLPGQCMEAKEKTCPGGWCHVEYAGKDAFVQQKLVSGPQTCAHPTKAPQMCFNNHCGATGSNRERGCDDYGCGYYGAPRGSGTHGGSDVICSGAGTRLNAPFDGYLWRQVRPYGDGSCCDDGYEFMSTDPEYPNFSAVVFYAGGYRIGADATRGSQVAEHLSLLCGCYGAGMTDHSHFELWENIDNRLDPTSFLYCNFV